jgi:hypothetical protein
MANKDLEFITIPKDTCFLSGIDHSNLTKNDIWLSYYGFENVKRNNINHAIEFSERYGEKCGIAFFRNKEKLKLLYIPYFAMYMENNQNVKNKGLQTLKTLINFVEETKININKKSKNSMKLALYEVFLNENSPNNISKRNELKKKPNINISINGIPNPDLLTGKIVKEYSKEIGFDGWIRKSKKDRITKGDEIYLFDRKKLLLDCNESCTRGTTALEKDFCTIGCKYVNVNN